MLKILAINRYIMNHQLTDLIIHECRLCLKNLKKSKKPFMATFYKDVRKKSGILMGIDGNPIGGKWSFDEDNRNKLPKNIEAFAAEQQYHYRNKGSFAVQGKTSDPQIGFYSEGSHNVADSPFCDILLEPINKTKEWLRYLLKKNQISIYHEEHHRGLLRGLVIRHSESTGETLVGLVTNEGRFPRNFLVELTKENELKKLGIVGLIQNINPQTTNVILGKENKILWGEKRFTDKLGNCLLYTSDAADE